MKVEKPKPSINNTSDNSGSTVRGGLQPKVNPPKPEKGTMKPPSQPSN